MRRRNRPVCPGCRRRIRNRIYLRDIRTNESWHVACREGAVTT